MLAKLYTFHMLRLGGKQPLEVGDIQQIMEAQSAVSGHGSCTSLSLLIDHIHILGIGLELACNGG